MSSSIPIPIRSAAGGRGQDNGGGGGGGGVLSGSVVGASGSSLHVGSFGASAGGGGGGLGGVGVGSAFSSPSFMAVGTPKGLGGLGGRGGLLPLSQLSPLMIAHGIFANSSSSGASANAGGAVSASASSTPVPAPVTVTMTSMMPPSVSAPALLVPTGGGGGGLQPSPSLHISTSSGVFSPTAIQIMSMGGSGGSASGGAAGFNAALGAASGGSTAAGTSSAPPPRPASPPLGDSACLRKTKIICTLGPATSTPEKLAGLLQAGMNVARFNFSHGTHPEHLEMLGKLRAACAATGLHCALLLDTKGPEIRTGLLKDKTLSLRAGEVLLLRTDLSLAAHSGEYRGDAVEGVSVDYPRLGAVLSPGATLKIDDGLIVTRVVEVLGEGLGVRVRVENAAVLGERKGVNLPNTEVDLPNITERDKADLRFGVANGFDFVAASFTRSADAVHEMRALLIEAMQQRAGTSPGAVIVPTTPSSPPAQTQADGRYLPPGSIPHIIAKIENQQGLDAFDAILEASDGIMVARGDLGVEIPIQKVSTVQKQLIHKCNLRGKPVITATQMLESMTTNPRPTRAEATDVSNAVLDGSDGVMLSGETAKGAYPIEAVRIMSAICVTAEQAMDYQTLHTQVVLSLQAQRQKKAQVQAQARAQAAAAQAQTPVNVQMPPTPAAASASGGVGVSQHAISMRPSASPALPLLRKGEAITAAAVKASMDLSAGVLVVYSESGGCARLVAKYRPRAPIVLLTPNRHTHAQARLLRGVWAVLVPERDKKNVEALIETALAFACARRWIPDRSAEGGSGPVPPGAATSAPSAASAAPGSSSDPATAVEASQIVILVSGTQPGVCGATNTMRILDV